MSYWPSTRRVHLTTTSIQPDRGSISANMCLPLLRNFVQRASKGDKFWSSGLGLGMPVAWPHYFWQTVLAELFATSLDECKSVKRASLTTNYWQKC